MKKLLASALLLFVTLSAGVTVAGADPVQNSPAVGDVGVVKPLNHGWGV